MFFCFFSFFLALESNRTKARPAIGVGDCSTSRRPRDAPNSTGWKKHSARHRAPVYALRPPVCVWLAGWLSGGFRRFAGGLVPDRAVALARGWVLAGCVYIRMCPYLFWFKPFGFQRRFSRRPASSPPCGAGPFFIVCRPSRIQLLGAILSSIFREARARCLSALLRGLKKMFPVKRWQSAGLLFY